MIVNKDKAPRPTGSRLPIGIKLLVKFFAKRYHKIVAPYNPSRKVIFLLGHQRSGSTLFTHLLISNPAIIGYGETHIAYRSQKDFERLHYDILLKRKFTGPLTAEYIYDKILLNQHIYPEHLNSLLSKNLYVVFLIRDYMETLNSLMKWGRTEEAALQSYQHRLRMLEKYASILAESNISWRVITYNDILYRSNDVFILIEKYLQLQEHLTEQYDIFPTTGRISIGDFSKNIREGRIVHNKKKYGVNISEYTREKARNSFLSCLDKVRYKKNGRKNNRIFYFFLESMT